MSTCQHCTRKTSLPLCTPCTQNLAALLAELPWLIHQLDITLTRQDHLHVGGGHTSLNSNPLNVGAMELMRDVSRTLHQIAVDVAQIHTGERIPALTNASPSQVAIWLKTNLRAIQNHPDAGKHYQAITTIVGDTQPGQIHNAINRPDQHFAGPCPTLRTHNQHGEPIHCGHILWAHDGEQFTTCPRCNCQIDVEANRRRATTLNDLLPPQLILEILTTIGEPLQPRRLYSWISMGKLPRQGFLTRKGWNKHRTQPSDPPVYSLTRARQLRQHQHESPTCDSQPPITV